MWAGRLFDAAWLAERHSVTATSHKRIGGRGAACCPTPSNRPMSDHPRNNVARRMGQPLFQSSPAEEPMTPSLNWQPATVHQ